MPRVGFEPTISAGERPKTYALDRVATGTGEQLWITLSSRKDEGSMFVQNFATNIPDCTAWYHNPGVCDVYIQIYV